MRDLEHEHHILDLDASLSASMNATRRSETETTNTSGDVPKPRKAVTFKTGLITERSYRPRTGALVTIEQVRV